MAVFLQSFQICIFGQINFQAPAMAATTPPEEVQQIKALIGEDQLMKACERLGSAKAVIAIKGRLKELEQRNKRGTLERGAYEASKNKIREDLLALVDELEKDTQKPAVKNFRFVWLILGLALLIGVGVIGFVLLNSKETPTTTNTTIFSPDDSTSFNVLILRFEDYVAKSPTECIGLAIEERLNVIKANEQLPLPLQTHYADTIPRPKSIEEAQQIQKLHHADLVIYGLAQNVQEGCAGADICFRYNIADKVVANIAPVIEVQTTKHDSDYTSTTPMDIEKGVLKIDNLSLKYWITSLMNVKINKPDEAFLELDKIGADTTLNDVEKAQRFLTIGDTYSDLKQHQRAIQAYNKAIELNPEYADAFYKRGLSYLDLERHQQSIQDFDQAVKLKPDFALAYAYRGNAYRSLKLYDQAVEDYGKSIHLNSSYAWVFNNRGLSFYDIDKSDKAINDFKKAIELNPNYDRAYNNLGISYYQLKLYEEAIDSYSKAVELNPSFASVYNNRGSALSALNQFDSAIQDYNKAIQLNNNSSLFYNNRGNAFKDLKQFKQAIINYDKAIQLDSNNTLPYNNRGITYRSLKMPKKAILDYNKAIQLDSNYTLAYNNRGNAYCDLKQYRLAIQNYDKVLELDPNFKLARKNRELALEKLTQQNN